MQTHKTADETAGSKTFKALFEFRSMKYRIVSLQFYRTGESNLVAYKQINPYTLKTFIYSRLQEVAPTLYVNIKSNY